MIHTNLGHRTNFWVKLEAFYSSYIRDVYFARLKPIFELIGASLCQS